MLALVCLANPLFSASGSTLLLSVGPVRVYLESLAYGACMGGLMVSAVVWLEDAACVLTQDRLLALGPRPRRLREPPGLDGLPAGAAASAAQPWRSASLDACTAASAAPSPTARLTRVTTQLMAWSLEDSLERADAMRPAAGSPALRAPATAGALRGGDILAVCGIALLSALCAVLAAAACGAVALLSRYAHAACVVGLRTLCRPHAAAQRGGACGTASLEVL